MTVDFGYETCAGAVPLGAYFLLLPLSKDRGRHKGVVKADQQFIVSVKIRCVQGERAGVKDKGNRRLVAPAMFHAGI